MQGWLSPDGTFTECSLYGHLDVIAEIPGVTNLVPELDDQISSLNSLHDGMVSFANEVGNTHAEWHRYEMAYDEAGCYIRGLMLDRGFVRVGQLGSELHFEGRPQTLRDRFQSLKDFAEEHDCTATFEPA